MSEEVFYEEKVSTEGILLPYTPFVLVLVLLAPKLYLDCKYSSILNLKTGHFLEKS